MAQWLRLSFVNKIATIALILVILVVNTLFVAWAVACIHAAQHGDLQLAIELQVGGISFTIIYPCLILCIIVALSNNNNTSGR